MSAVVEGTVPLPDGGHLAYDLAGEGPMLTMIHPGLWDRRTWDRGVRRLDRSVPRAPL